MTEKNKVRKIPTLAELEEELGREKSRRNYLRVLKSTVFTLITVAAIAVLIAVLLLPVLQIYGTSMSPTVEEGDIVVSVKGDNFETGDLVAFYYNNKILVKRVIGQSGDWVDIDEDGNVYVNNQLIEEPYLQNKSIGECDITLPYQVPDSKIFVMGDNRSISIDSRSSTVGCVSSEQVVGKIQFRVWPLRGFGGLN